MTEASTHYLRKHDNISLFPQDRCIHHFVEEQALVRANAVALIDRCKTYTYEKVNQRANQVARYIHSLNLPEESIIAVMFDRSAEMIYSMLGVLKARYFFCLLTQIILASALIMFWPIAKQPYLSLTHTM